MSSLRINSKLSRDTAFNIGISGNVSMTSSYTEVDNFILQNSYNNENDDIIIENGKIKINGNIKAIKLVGAFGFLNSPGQIFMWPRKNGSNFGKWQVQTTTAQYNSFVVSQLLPVSQGDIVSIAFYTNNNTTIEAAKTGAFLEIIR